MQSVNAVLVTNLKLLVGHGGQSCHVEGEVARRSDAYLRIRRLVEAHGQTLEHILDSILLVKGGRRTCTKCKYTLYTPNFSYSVKKNKFNPHTCQNESFFALI